MRVTIVGLWTTPFPKHNVNVTVNVWYDVFHLCIQTQESVWHLIRFFYITKNLESCLEVIRMLLSPKLLAWKQRRPHLCLLFIGNISPLPFPDIFKVAFLWRPLKINFITLKAEKKDKDIAYCGTLSANQLQVSKILKYAVHDCLMLPSTVKTSFAHFWPPRCRWLA